jgi:hypothetical protein
MWLSLGGRFGSKQSQMAADMVAPTLKPVQKHNADLAMERWMKKYDSAQKKDEDEEEKEER